MAADKRLLCRAALFLWIIFLSAILSMVLIESEKTALAAVLSPAMIAFCTFLIALRRVERKLTLWIRCLTACRARLRACALFAIVLFQPEHESRAL